jgi:hypothetical protein
LKKGSTMFIHPKFKIRSFGIEDKDVGSSSTWLLNKLRISKFVKLAKAGVTTDILLWVRVIRVKLSMVTIE